MARPPPRTPHPKQALSLAPLSASYSKKKSQQKIENLVITSLCGKKCAQKKPTQSLSGYGGLVISFRTKSCLFFLGLFDIKLNQTLLGKIKHFHEDPILTPPPTT